MWATFKAIIADNIPAEQFDAWFRPVNCVSFEADALTIDVPSPFFVEQLEDRYGHLIVKALKRVYGPDAVLYYRYYQVSGKPDTAVKVRDSRPSAASANAAAARRPDSRPAPRCVGQLPPLNPRYTFDNYCSSMSNKVARSIGEAIANDPNCKTFNPLVIFGPSGVGKTHLMQAIGLRMLENNPATRVLYVTARLFESQFTKANKEGEINDFLYFYQSVDTLIIDDIQDLAGKPKTQNTFFHIFNHLIQNQRQLILSCDQPPALLDGLEARLIGRFRQGMTAELSRPDYELRRRVLTLKAEQDGLDLADDVIDFIAAGVSESIRDIEGIIVSLVAHATVLGRPIDLDLARSVIHNSVRSQRPQLNFDIVAEAVAQHYGLDTDLLFTKTRKREVAEARQLVMYLVKKHTKLPLKAIGQRLNRTHATVLYACSQVDDRLSWDKKLRADIDALSAELLKR